MFGLRISYALCANLKGQWPNPKVSAALGRSDSLESGGLDLWSLPASRALPLRLHPDEPELALLPHLMRDVGL